MRRNDRRAARESKRTIPDFTPPQPVEQRPSDSDWHAANDQQALREQIQRERHVSGTTRGLY